jgi:hypothetical protein
LLAALRTLCYSGHMKIPPLVISPLCLSLTVVSAAAANSPGLDALQGAWSIQRTNQEGQVVLQTMEFKQDRMTFRIAGSDGELRFFAKGAAAVEKLGPFQSLKITSIQAGRSEESTEAVDDERTSVFLV